MKRVNRREEMIAALSRREREGLSYKEISKELGISRWTLYEWARRLRAEKEEAGARFVEVALPGAGQDPWAIEVLLGEGRRLRVERGFDQETLRRVVEVLESC